jgi:N,N-dimethylformamidase
MTELVGYLDRWSARPGDTVAVYLSSDRPARVGIDLLRLGSGDERAEPDGIACAPVESMPPIEVELGPQRTDAGSYAQIDGLGRLELERATLGLLLQPWSVGGDEQTVLAFEAPGADLAVVLDASGAIGVRVDGRYIALSWRPTPRRWSVLKLAWQTATLSLVMMTTEGRTVASAHVDLTHPLGGFERLRLAGCAEPDGSVGAQFDGRIERPILWSAQVDDALLHSALLVDEAAPTNACACWDFALGIDGNHIFDTGPNGLHGTLHQGPKRAVRGARWRGTQFDWRRAPADYAAIHFHRDDLLDAAWPAAARLRLPQTIGSGAYAVRARCLDASPEESLTGGVARLPRFVRGRRGSGGAADGAVVLPTLTNLA